MDLGATLAALIVSLSTLLISGLALRQKADTVYVTHLESRVAALESQLASSERERGRLLEENIYLMKQLVRPRPKREA